MSNDMIPRTPAEENPWYKLAIMPCGSEPSNHIWNGYMRFLMEHNREGADEVRVKVKVILNDGKEDYKEVGLPNLTPNELTSVQAINGLPGDMDEISFENCIFDNGTDFQSFYFPTDVSFENANFESQANFKNASFASVTDFSEAKFAESVFFTGTDFANATFFKNASFKSHTYFRNAIFASVTDFSEAKFAEKAFFTDAIFTNQADFKNASFADLADFKNAIFEDQVVFNNASFAGFTGFSEVSFEGGAYFIRAKFADRADFSSAKFENLADFSASSDTSPHKGSVFFVGATFKQAPAFFERQLHEDTNWKGVIWSEPPLSKQQAGEDVRRYECLSLMMSKLEKYDDMHTFFRLSMRAKEIRDGRWSVTSLMSRTYGKLFDYGWGVKHAFRLWVGHIFLGFLLILGLMSINGLPQSIGVLQSFMLSFSNAHSFIGLHNGALASLYRCAAAGDNSSWFNVIWVLQTVFGLPLLFFLLLTIRNRFRMR